MAGPETIRDRLQAVDYVHVLGLGAVSIATLASWDRIAFGPWILGADLALIGAVVWLALGPLHRAAPSHAALARLVISYAVVTVVFSEMSVVVPAVNPVRYDAQLLDLDLALFALHPATSFNGLHHPILSELFAIAYVSFYMIPFAFFVLLYRQGSLDRIETGNLAVVASFYLSYLGNALVPAASPVRTIEPDVALEGLVFFDFIYARIDRWETHTLSAFPSGHLLVVLVVVLLLAKWRSGALPLFLAWMGLLWVSTIYLRYHYLIDTIVSVPLALLCVAAALAFRRWLARANPRKAGFASD
jgi:hypothetical protein